MFHDVVQPRGGAPCVDRSMRWIGFLFVIGCTRDTGKHHEGAKELKGPELEQFCRQQKPEDCAKHPPCEAVVEGCEGHNPNTGSGFVGCDPYLVCRAKR